MLGQTEMIPLKGNGFAIKDRLKAMGGIHDASKRWKVPADRFVEAENLLKNHQGNWDYKDRKSGKESDPADIDALMRANFVFLRDEVLYSRSWNIEAEVRILDCAKRLGASGHDVGWVEKALDCKPVPHHRCPQMHDILNSVRRSGAENTLESFVRLT